MSRVNEQISELERQRTYMYDAHHFPRDHAQVERFNSLHPWQRRQIVRECALREIRESMGTSGVPLSESAIAVLDWESAMTTAAAVRTDSPDCTTAGQVDWMRERGVPMKGPRSTVTRDREKERAGLAFLTESGVPVTVRVPSTYTDEHDQPVHMTPAEQRRWLRESGVPLREAGGRSTTIPDAQCQTCGGNGIAGGTVCEACGGTGEQRPTPSSLSSGKAQPKAPAQTPSSLSTGTAKPKVTSDLHAATGAHLAPSPGPEFVGTGQAAAALSEAETRQLGIAPVQWDDHGNTQAESVDGNVFLRESGIPMKAA